MEKMTKQVKNEINKDLEQEDLFGMYVSSEPEAKLPFTGPSASVGRTSSFATSTCGSIASK
jgi:hypothetical protein